LKPTAKVSRRYRGEDLLQTDSANSNHASGAKKSPNSRPSRLMP